MIRIDAAWLAVEPLDMRAGTDTVLARIVAVFGKRPLGLPELVRGLKIQGRKARPRAPCRRPARRVLRVRGTARRRRD
jgi:hypothetical protein